MIAEGIIGLTKIAIFAVLVKSQNTVCLLHIGPGLL